jgi:hypothetical protein
MFDASDVVGELIGPVLGAVRATAAEDTAAGVGVLAAGKTHGRPPT